MEEYTNADLVNAMDEDDKFFRVHGTREKYRKTQERHRSSGSKKSKAGHPQGQSTQKSDSKRKKNTLDMDAMHEDDMFFAPHKTKIKKKERRHTGQSSKKSANESYKAKRHPIITKKKSKKSEITQKKRKSKVKTLKALDSKIEEYTNKEGEVEEQGNGTTEPEVEIHNESLPIVNFKQIAKEAPKVVKQFFSKHFWGRSNPKYGDDKGDSSETNSEDRLWIGPEQYGSERDDEWLDVDEEYTGQNSVPERDINMDRKGHNLGNGCKEFMDVTKYFWWSLLLGGRMPFNMYSEDGIVKFRVDKRSKTFVYFLCTSFFLLTCTISMAHSLIRLLFAVPGAHVDLYEQVESVEVDKYWFYSLATLLTCTIASTWSMAMWFDDGIILADFLTGWNNAVGVLKYRPFARVKIYFWINTFLFWLYAIVVVYIFSTGPENPFHVSAVRGASGLIGYTILHPFVPDIRFSPNYFLVEVLGLFVHLYSTYSSRSILVMVTLYCNMLVNMQKKWNIRVYYVLRTIDETLNREPIAYDISFKRLFAEHRIVIGFLRHLGRVFAVGLGTFYTLKMVEITILGYRVMSLFVFPTIKHNMTHLEGIPDFLPPIKLNDHRGQLVGSAIVILLISLTEWFMTSVQITSCGDTILDGFSFVRRRGHIMCKTSRRRRFVQSLNHGFSELSDYYVRSGYTINRAFIFNTFFWLVSALSLLTAFSPFQLSRENAVVCSSSGNCVVVSRSRIAWRSSTDSKEMVMEMVENVVLREIGTTTVRAASTNATTTTTTTTPPTTTSTTTSTTTTTTTSTTTSTTTASSLLPPPFNKCPAIGSLPEIMLPNICRPDGSIVKAYGIRGPDGGTTECIDLSLSASAQTLRTLLPYYSLSNLIQVQQCPYNASNPRRQLTTVNGLNPFMKDACYNIKSDSRLGVPAIQVPVKIARGTATFVFCCYDYGFSPLQLESCNTPFRSAVLAGCRNNEGQFYDYNKLSMQVQKCVDDRGASGCESINECLCGIDGVGQTVNRPAMGSVDPNTCPLIS